MPFLFSYGTLQLAGVQRATFGRLLQGEDDALVGFELGMASGHVNVTSTGRTEDRVAGVAYEITDAELVAADRYEQRASFGRIGGVLASGRQAWLYVYVGSGELRRPRIDPE
jgi:hypothetical protein